MVVVEVVAEGVEEADLAVAATRHGDVVLPLTPQFGAASPVHGQGPDHVPTTEVLLVTNTRLPRWRSTDEAVDREMIGVRLPQFIFGSICILELWG